MGSIALVVVAVVPLACGNGGVTKKDFIAKGDAICKRLSVQSRKVKEPTSDTEIDEYLQQVLAIAVQARADLAEVDAPTDGDKVKDVLLSSLDDTITKARQARAAAAKGDMEALQQRLGEAGAAASRADKQAKAYGFTDCSNS